MGIYAGTFCLHLRRERSYRSATRFRTMMNLRLHIPLRYGQAQSEAMPSIRWRRSRRLATQATQKLSPTFHILEARSSFISESFNQMKMAPLIEHGQPRFGLM